MRNQHIRFGHPLASDAKKEELSPTGVDVDPAAMFAWGADSSAMQVTPIGEDLQLDASGKHDVSDAELLEVLSCLLDDEPASSKEGAKDAAATTETKDAPAVTVFKDATTVDL
ncbi:unnamed protein product [Phytophthora lilii]|uniref:Unnamed protein product n=1 Tax=Phytophthora lilii TaxID=2077276 RepID=A0A9W6TEF8_9STRA|nr:unnamed protein product [Phytophthora lilii]